MRSMLGSDHQIAVVDTRLHPADVVAHDKEDVRFLRAPPASLGSRTHSSTRKNAHDVRSVCLSRLRRSDPTSARGKASDQYKSKEPISIPLRAIEDSFERPLVYLCRLRGHENSSGLFLKTPSMVCNSAALSRDRTHHDFLEIRRIMLARPGFFFITVITGGERTLPQVTRFVQNLEGWDYEHAPYSLHY
jgi:hypothetical protein